MAEKVLAMLKGGAKSVEVLSQELEVLARLMGVGQKVLPCLEWWGGGGRKKFRTCDFPIL